jgi:sortase A
MTLPPRERTDPAPVAEAAILVAEPDRRWTVRSFISSTLFMLAVVLLGFAASLAGASWLEHRSAQVAAFNTLRIELANGTAPVAQTDSDGKLLDLGAPVARLTIPAIGLNEVVLEGTTSGVLTAGPGHERDTVLPGQAGTSIIMGRAAAYGGPFRNLQRLDFGATITVTTGQGVSTYRVIGSRRAGDMVPPPLAAGKGRMTLVTATGTPFMPDGLLRVDADLVSAVQPTPRAVIPRGSVPAREQAMGTDASTAWALAFLLQGLLLVAVGATWAWRRWGRPQTWIVFLPLTLLFGLEAADQLARLLPNLL